MEYLRYENIYMALLDACSFQKFSNWWHSPCLDTGWGWTMQSWPKKSTSPCKLQENISFVVAILRWKFSSNYICEDYFIMCFTMIAVFILWNVQFEVIQVPFCCNHRYKELASRQGTTYMPGGKVQDNLVKTSRIHIHICILFIKS